MSNNFCLVPLQLNWDKNSKNKITKIPSLHLTRFKNCTGWGHNKKTLQLIVIISYANESTLFNYTTYSIIYSYISLTHETLCVLEYLSYIIIYFVISNANWQCNWRVLFELFTLINKLSFFKKSLFYFHNLFIFFLFF